jgi:hypothetical protein
MVALFAFLCRRLLTPLISGNQRRKRAAVPFRELQRGVLPAQLWSMPKPYPTSVTLSI